MGETFRVNKPEQESDAGGCARIMCGGGDCVGERRGEGKRMKELQELYEYTPTTGFRCERLSEIAELITAAALIEFFMLLICSTYNTKDNAGMKSLERRDGTIAISLYFQYRAGQSHVPILNNAGLKSSL